MSDRHRTRSISAPAKVVILKDNSRSPSCCLPWQLQPFQSKAGPVIGDLARKREREREGKNRGARIFEVESETEERERVLGFFFFVLFFSFFLFP